jgi:hypothetical protein
MKAQSSKLKAQKKFQTPSSNNGSRLKQLGAGAWSLELILNFEL